jgi:prepilin peptidase CpaA
MTYIALILFPALMIYAAFSDLFTMTIHNNVSFALVAGFLILSIAKGFNMHDYLMHLGAGLLVLVVTIGFFAMNWMGGGDAKLASATALWFGFTPALYAYLAYASVLGGILTFALIFLRKFPLPSFLHSQNWLLVLHHEKTGVPYGIALAIAGLLVYQNSIWLK